MLAYVVLDALSGMETMHGMLMRPSCVGGNNSMLLKRKSAGGVTFSRDPMNLTNVHNRKYEGFIDTKVCKKPPLGLLALLTSPGHRHQPFSSQSLGVNPHHQEPGCSQSLWRSFETG